MPRIGRPPVTLTAHGKTLTLRQWAAETGMSLSTVRLRIYMGWPPEAVVDTPTTAKPESGKNEVREKS
jgi:hypothetical protein